MELPYLEYKSYLCSNNPAPWNSHLRKKETTYIAGFKSCSGSWYTGKRNLLGFQTTPRWLGFWMVYELFHFPDYKAQIRKSSYQGALGLIKMASSMLDRTSGKY